MSEPLEPAGRDPLQKALSALASAVRRLDAAEATGELASLRRMNPESPECMAFIRLSVMKPVDDLIGHMAADIGGPEALRRLAAIAQMMAFRPDGLRPWGLGRDLDRIGFTGHRLGTLLTAREVALRDNVRRLARRLARDADALAFEELGKLLVLSDWREDAAEDTRLKIAREVARAEREAQRAASANAV